MTAGAAIAKYSDNKSQTSPLGTSSLFALWLLISLACLTCIILIFTPTYRSNDDVLSTMLYSGKLIIDQPTPDYWVSNILFGRSISKLYTHFPKIPWYSFAIYACYLIPLALVGLVSTLKGLNRFAIGTLVIWLVICVLPLTTQPQFTTASTFACGIGMYSIIWILCCSNLPTYQLRIVLIASMLTIILGSCIRAEGLILGGIPNVLFLVHLWYSGKTDLRKLCQWLGATFTVCLALYLIDYMHFRLQPEWRDFMQFRDAATRVIDAGDTKFMDRAVIAAKGWSKEELELLRDHWFMVDPDIVSQQHLENLLSATPGMLSKVVSNLSSNETYLRLKGELFRELPYLICFI